MLANFRLMGAPLSPTPKAALKPTEIRVTSRANSIASVFSVGLGQKLDGNTNSQYMVVFSPLLAYMRLLGLTCYTENPALRRPLKTYNIIVMIIMNSYSAFNISQLKFDELNANFAFTTIQACHLASGGICSLLLFWMQKSFNRLSLSVIKQVATCDSEFQQAKRVHHMCKLMVGLTVFWAAISVLVTSAIHKKVVRDEPSGAVDIILLLIQYYVAFLAQSALMSWSIFFGLPCYVLLICVDVFTRDMHHVGIAMDGKWTTSEAVDQVLKYKHRYRDLKKTADVIEEQFKYAIAYVEALGFTELCFVLYTYLHDESTQKTWIDTALCASYTINILFHMAFFTAPAYLVYERNQTIGVIATTMFQDQLHRNPDQFLACLLLLFGSKLKAAEISFTAGGFFVVTRQLILTIVSLVLTYVVIMLQFGHMSGGCLIRNIGEFNTSRSSVQS